MLKRRETLKKMSNSFDSTQGKKYQEILDNAQQLKKKLTMAKQFTKSFKQPEAKVAPNPENVKTQQTSNFHKL